MFQENQDISVYLTPFSLPENTFFKEGDETAPASLRELFTRLEHFLSCHETEVPALHRYVSDSDVQQTVIEGFDVFKRKTSSALSEENQDPDAIYAKALAYFDDDKIKDAEFLFALMSTLEAGKAHVLYAMAACACRQSHFRHAYDLAIESLSGTERHPRAYLLAGYCALKLKDTKNAKRFLALASRIARKDQTFAPEQRYAQRELLMLQFAS